MCSCASCKYTDRIGLTAGRKDSAGNFIPGSAFAEWPKGEGRNRGADRAYAAHWAHCNAMRPYKAPDKLPDAAVFYGTPVGSTRGEVERVLRATFGLGEMPQRAGPVPAPVQEFIAAHPEIAAANAAARAERGRSKPVQAGPSIAELLQRAIDMRAERERIAA